MTQHKVSILWDSHTCGIALQQPVGGTRFPFGVTGHQKFPAEICSRELSETLVGRDVGRDSYIAGQSRERELKEQTEAIVRRLGNVGIDGRLHGREIAMVGLVSGIAKPIQAVRNSNILPNVQSHNLHKML